MLNRDNAILVVVDVQGKLAQLMFEKSALFKGLYQAVAGCRILDVPVLWLEQLPDKLGSTIPEVADQLPDLQPIAKSSFGCMGSIEFREALYASGRKHIILCGIETHICVYQSAMQLLEAGYEVTILEDATSSRTPENRSLGVRKMISKGVSPSSVEMLLFELMGDATDPDFREVALLIK
ncbi:MAG: hydrolase [Pseudomonadales bacterium]|nr:hydrolase [Pseudomonadales bacterium]